MNDPYKALCKSLAFIFLVLLAALLLSIILSGCRTTRTVTQTVIKTDTVTVQRDSIIIRQRIDTVEIPLPMSAQMIEVPIDGDTMSVLSDRYYTSMAAVTNGRLRHTLTSNPGASLSGAAVVHDTIKIFVDSTMINNQRNVATTKEVTPSKPPWLMRILFYVLVAVIAGKLISIYAEIKK